MFYCFSFFALQVTCCICLRGDLSATLFSVFKDSKNWRLSQLTATFSPWGICFVACSCFFCPNSTNQLFFAVSLKCHRNLFLPRPSEIIFRNLIWRRLSVKPASFLNSFRVFYSPGLLVFYSSFTCLPMLLSQPSFLLPPNFTILKISAILPEFILGHLPDFSRLQCFLMKIWNTSDNLKTYQNRKHFAILFYVLQFCFSVLLIIPEILAFYEYL